MPSKRIQRVSCRDQASEGSLLYSPVRRALARLTVPGPVGVVLQPPVGTQLWWRVYSVAAEALRFVLPELLLAEMGHFGLAPLLRVSGEAL